MSPVTFHQIITVSKYWSQIPVRYLPWKTSSSRHLMLLFIEIKTLTLDQSSQALSVCLKCMLISKEALFIVHFNTSLDIYLTSLQNTSEHKELKDPARDPQYSEPQIDAMRAQKDQVTHLNQSHTCTHVAAQFQKPRQSTLLHLHTGYTGCVTVASWLMSWQYCD